MAENKQKDGISVKEIENYAKKHKVEVFFCLAFVLASFFSFVFFTGWGLALGAIGGILGVLMPSKVENITKSSSQFVAKQEQITQLILGIVGLVFAIFLPPLIFLVLGLHGGKSLQKAALDNFNK